MENKSHDADSPAAVGDAPPMTVNRQRALDRALAMLAPAALALGDGIAVARAGTATAEETTACAEKLRVLAAKLERLANRLDQGPNVLPRASIADAGMTLLALSWEPLASETNDMGPAAAADAIDQRRKASRLVSEVARAASTISFTGGPPVARRTISRFWSTLLRTRKPETAAVDEFVRIVHECAVGEFRAAPPDVAAQHLRFYWSRFNAAAGATVTDERLAELVASWRVASAGRTHEGKYAIATSILVGAGYNGITESMVRERAKKQQSSSSRHAAPSAAEDES